MHNKEREVANIAAGRIPKAADKWYVCDDENKTLYGPSKVLSNIAEAMGAARITERKLGGRMIAIVMSDPVMHGMRAIRGPEARRLAEYEGYILREPTNDSDRKRDREAVQSRADRD